MSEPHPSTLGLNEKDLHPNPIRQFALWFEQALSANLPEPNAMTLATASRDGTLSARIVLLKAYDARGFRFFTNYESHKGRELADNPRAALVLFWPTMERQIRITGDVSKTSREESEEYFHSRPLGSQLGAWASLQSQVLQSREELERQVEALAQRYGENVPLPPHWGGYCVAPQEIEFWQGRPSRLHDRIRYTRVGEDAWKIERLSP
jgi:pyridoxamine 5'-phosphate oxidase